MQVIFENEDERSNSRESSTINTIICIERISRCMKGKFVKGLRIRRSRIWISRKVFIRIKERIWKRR